MTTADDASRPAELRRMQRWATGLLFLAGGVFLAARLLEPDYPWLGFVRATAEAALVGGIADWFAVTALFRRPLGLPIPHTAIIPTQKDRIGALLGVFVQDHFLTRDVLLVKLRSMRLAERSARWIGDPAQSAQIASHLAPAVGEILASVRADGGHHKLFDAALRLAGEALDTHGEDLRDRLRGESPWWVPRAVDNLVYRKLIGGAHGVLEEIAADPNHPFRRKFDDVVQGFADRLRYADDFVPSLARAISATGTALLADETRLAELDARLTETIASAVERHRHEAGDLITQTVRQWDAGVAARRIELAVGRDLQFIRLNGTLVGGLVGLVLYSLSWLIE